MRRKVKSKQETECMTLSQGDGSSGIPLESAALSVKGRDISAVILSRSYGERTPNPVAYILRESNLKLPGAVDYAEVIALGRATFGPMYFHFPLEQVDCAALDGMLSQ